MSGIGAWCGWRTSSKIKGSDLRAYIGRKIVAVTVALAFKFVLYWLVVAASYVPDFCIPSGTGFPAVGHVIWMIGNGLSAGAVALAFILMFVAEIGKKPYKGMRYAMPALTFAIIMMILSFVANGIHFGFSLAEVIECLSDLCMNVASANGKTFLIILIVALGLLVLLDFYITYRLIVIYRDSKRAWSKKEQAETLEDEVEDYMEDMPVSSSVRSRSSKTEKQTTYAFGPL